MKLGLTTIEDRLKEAIKDLNTEESIIVLFLLAAREGKSWFAISEMKRILKENK
jgi:hypothetical protein